MILASLVVVWPALIAPALLMFLYSGIWISFNVVRAVADDTPWGASCLDLVHRLEAAMTAGHLPGVWLQDTIFNADRPRWYDTLATVVYLSYFIVPHLVALVLVCRNRNAFRRYVTATGRLFLVSALCFIVLPANPPWRASEAVRVVPHLLSRTAFGPLLPHSGSPDSSYALEPNAVASWPSVHVGMTVVLALLATGASRRWGIAGAVYALLMGASLVYLGEHYLIDVAGGGVIAMLAWRASPGWVRSPHRAEAGGDAPSASPVRRDRVRRPQSGSIDGVPRSV